MAFTDVINNYSNGATGTLTDSSGDTVDYTVTSSTWTVDWNGLTSGARVNANGTQTFTVTFDTPVVGATIQISGSNASEIYYIEVDGVTVNLQTLINNGDVTMTQSGAATHEIGADGSIYGGNHWDGSIAELVFNIPVTSLGAYGTNGGGGNWDYFEVGLDSSVFNVVCFTKGTLIATNHGECPIETLSIGDNVQTLQGTSKPIRWIGRRQFDAKQLKKNPKLRPVRITAGALGNGLPRADLLVSRQHRILVSSKIALRMFGVSDVLIAAIKLAELPGIFVDEDVDSVEYIHVLFDKHEVILAEGAPSESLFTGAESMKSIPPAARKEIFEIFPELREMDALGDPARFIPNGKLQKQLVKRHVKNKKIFLEQFVDPI